MGVSQSIKEDASLMTEQELYERISVKLAGKLAEEKFYSSNSSSLVESDLRGAYSMARNMITNYGMSKKTENFHWNEKGFKSYRWGDIYIYIGKRASFDYDDYIY